MHKTTLKKINNYSIIKRVGSGCVGETFKANNDERFVAIKFVDTRGTASVNLDASILQSSVKLGALNHPAIAAIQEANRHEDRLYVVSEWVEGDSLAKSTTHEQLTLAQIGRIGEQMAQGLSYAHRQGVVHGGLHPHNVLLVNGRTATPQIKITDFLLSSLLPGDPPARLLPYLAPEQIASRRVNARSDIYSLGVILYQLVTGRLPFEPKSPREAATTDGDPISPQTLRPEVSPAFADLILKAASRPIRHRYHSMEAFLAALRPLLSTLPDDLPKVKAPPAPQPKQESTRVAAGQPAIQIDHPEKKRQQFPVGNKWLITMGSMTGNDLALPAEGVSEKHARLERQEDNSWTVVDMGSLRGTFLEDSRLLPDVAQTWQSGQTLQVGPYRLTWLAEAPAPEQMSAYSPPVASEKPLPVASTLAVALLPPTSHTEAGQPINIVVVLENETEETAVVRLTTGGIPDEWVTVDAGWITMPAGQTVRVPLAVQPPHHHTAVAGQHTVDVIVTPANDVSRTVTASAVFTIAPYHESLVALKPPSLRHGVAGKVQITNSGNSAGSARLQVIDVNETLSFDLSKDESELGPGEKTAIPLTISGKKDRAWIWEKRIAPFEVQVRTNQGVNSLPAQVIMPPRIPTILLGLVAIALITAVTYFGAAGICRSDTALLLRTTIPANGWSRVCTSLSGLASQRSIGASGAPDALLPTSMPVPTGTPEPTLPALAASDPLTTTVTPAVTPGAPREIEIGTSVQGQAITAVAFGSGDNAIVLVGGIHAGYAPGSVALIEDIIDHYQSDPEAAAAIPANLTLYFVANLNPDANLTPNNPAGRVNANNVNLNNNWPCRWDLASGQGRAPLSEPENRALSDFINDENTVAAIFWTLPVSEDIRGVVSPGRCQADQESIAADLMFAYAPEVQFEAKQADPDMRFGGDVTDSLVDSDIPAIFVLLSDAVDYDLDAHIAAFDNVLQLDFPLTDGN